MFEDDDASSRLADLRALDTLTQSLDKSTQAFGRSVTNAFSRGIVEGKRFEDVLRGVGRSMTDSLLKMALKPLQTGISNLLGSSIKGLGGLFSGGFGLGGGGAAPVATVAAAVAVPPAPPGDEGSDALSDRETQILRLIAKGLSFKEAGAALGISPHTVAVHLKRIYRKLAVHSRGEAVYEARLLGLL